MSKKHYEFIAWLIGQYVIPMSLHEEFGMDAPSRAMGVKLFITQLAAFLLEDNPRFDRCKFFEACGLGGVHFRVKPVEYVDAAN